MRKYSPRMGLLVTLGLVLLCHKTIANQDYRAADEETESFEILGCSKNCTYQSFITALDAAAEVEITHKISKGSKDNVKKLGEKSDEFAIVQADALYNGYRGKGGARRTIGYSILLPLFPNYVQLLARRGSGILNFEDLKGRRVGLGREGSGTQNNALDILKLAKLDPDKDIDKVEKTGVEGFALFDKGTLDAMFVTGRLRVPVEGGNFYHIEIPDRHITQLVKTPYYTKVKSPAELANEDSEDELLKFDSDMPSLTAYLVASELADKKDGRVERLLNAIVDSWPEIEWEGLQPIQGTEESPAMPARPIIPYHPKTREVLFARGYVGPIDKFYIFGGSSGGTYRKFIDVMNVGDEKTEFLHVESGGSKDNLKRLINGSECYGKQKNEGVCFAIVQDDAAFAEYYPSSGLSQYLPRNIWKINFIHETFGPGFRAVLPLFANYVQVLVRPGSGIEKFSDLKLESKRIGVGAAGSGTLSNAIDVLVASGIGIDEEQLIPGTEDKKFVFVSSSQGIGSLKSGELDALFVTGMLRIPPEDGAFRHLVIPEEIINRLTNPKKPYYVKIDSPGSGSSVSDNVIAKLAEAGKQYYVKIEPVESRVGFTAPMLSLTAYLLAADNASEESIRTVIQSLTESWSAIGDEYGWRMENLENVGTRTPIPFHPMTNKILVESNYVTKEKVYLGFLIGLALVIPLLVYGGRWLHKDAYNRLGEDTHVGSVLLEKLAPFLAIAYVLVFIFTGLLIVVIVVNFFEQAFSTGSNVENSFFRLDIWDTILWIFTFMSTGYENNVYPASTVSRIVVAIAALVGLVAPFALAYSFVSRFLEKRFSRLSGDAAFPQLNDHVLICGWNAKVKYLIWTLTGEDAPSKKHVVVIADIEGEKPLTHFNFDKELVNYCRGDSADNNILDRANAGSASMAIVVADEEKLKTDNLGSALTVLALRRKNPDLFIASELDSDQNRLFFDTSGSDAIVDSRFLSDRLLTLSCLYPLLCDFVLDAITHDEYSEFYSQSVEEVRKKFNIDDQQPTLASLQDHAHIRGLNIVGVEKPVSEVDERVGENGLSKKYAINLLLSSIDLQEKVFDSDTIVVAADDLAAIGASTFNQGMAELSPSPDCPRLIEEAPPQEILIIGEKKRAESVKEKLLQSSSLHEVTVLSPDDDTSTIERQIQELVATRSFDCVLMLNQAPGIDSLSDEKSFIGDAKVILRVQLITRLTRDNPAYRNRSKSLGIVAEVNQQKNRRLLIEAGATTVVPSVLLTARFLTKLVYGRGYVYRLIVTLLTMKNGTYLRSLELTEGHPLLGKTYLESLRIQFEDARVIGCLPNDQQVTAELRNEEGDFATHFVMSPTKENGRDKKRRGSARRNDADRVLIPGDTLILIGSDQQR